MDIWRVDYFLVSDLIKTLYTEYGNICYSWDDLIHDIDYALMQLGSTIERAADIPIQLFESPHTKIRDTLSKMHPDDIVLIKSTKIKNICEWADGDGLEAEE